MLPQRIEALRSSRGEWFAGGFDLDNPEPFPVVADGS